MYLLAYSILKLHKITMWYCGFILQHFFPFQNSFDWLLFGTGRAPNTKRLNLEAVGVELDRTGAVKVTSFLICFSSLQSLNILMCYYFWLGISWVDFKQ